MSKTNKLLKKETLDVPTFEDIRKYLLDAINAEIDPETILYKVRDFQLSKVELDSKGKLQKLEGNVANDLRNACNMLSLDTHYSLAGTMLKEYQPLMIEFARNLNKEFNCQNSVEKSLVHMVVGSYTRVLFYSRALTLLTDSKFISADKTGYFKAISKEIDRAQRQYLSGVQTLRTIKQPPFELEIKAKNAYVSQYQQINESPTEEKEVIEPI